MKVQVKKKSKDNSIEPDYSKGFIYGIILCSMLSVIPVRIGSVAILPVIIFLLCMGWMAANIVQINQGKKKQERKYTRLDITVLLLLSLELGNLILDLLKKTEEEMAKPDYSWNLLMVDLLLLYLLVMETKQFSMNYMDLILYGGLAVMAILLIGYLVEPQLGEIVGLWRDKESMASYLLMISIVSILQYCRCEEGMKRCFYGMCAGISFFLSGCNHSAAGFWILIVTIFMIPIMLRPTALLWKRAMQMLFLFFALISNMGLLTNYTGLFLMPVSYDLVNSVYLELILAAGSMVFFYCWYRIPEGTDQKEVIMLGLYQIDRMIVWGSMIVCLLFLTDHFAWDAGGWKTSSFKAVQQLALPLLEEVEKNQSFFYRCMSEQGMLPVMLCILALILYMERMHRILRWDRPVRGLLCVVGFSLLIQLFLWEIYWNILPVGVILVTSALSCEEGEGAFIADEGALNEEVE